MAKFITISKYPKDPGQITTCNGTLFVTSVDKKQNILCFLKTTVNNKTVLRNHQNSVIKRYIGNLNTPKPKQIDELFDSLLGLSKISKKWSWHKCKPAQARGRLEKLITLRGEIAHRVSATRSVHKSDVTQATSLIDRLAITSHNAVNASLRNRLGHSVWQEYQYQHTG